MYYHYSTFFVVFIIKFRSIYSLAFLIVIEDLRVSISSLYAFFLLVWLFLLFYYLFRQYYVSFFLKSIFLLGVFNAAFRPACTRLFHHPEPYRSMRPPLKILLKFDYPRACADFTQTLSLSSF